MTEMGEQSPALCVLPEADKTKVRRDVGLRAVKFRASRGMPSACGALVLTSSLLVAVSLQTAGQVCRRL